MDHCGNNYLIDTFFVEINLFCQKKNDPNVKKEGKLFSSKFSVSYSFSSLFRINNDHKARIPPLSHEDENMTRSRQELCERYCITKVLFTVVCEGTRPVGWYKFECLHEFNDS